MSNPPVRRYATPSSQHARPVPSSFRPAFSGACGNASASVGAAGSSRYSPSLDHFSLPHARAAPPVNYGARYPAPTARAAPSSSSTYIGGYASSSDADRAVRARAAKLRPFAAAAAAAANIRNLSVNFCVLSFEARFYMLDICYTSVIFS